MQDVDWTPDLAADIAEADGVGALGERHWRAIAAYRELAASDGRPPSLARISAACGLSIAELEELFTAQRRSRCRRSPAFRRVDHEKRREQ
jgi:hypothetical protein